VSLTIFVQTSEDRRAEEDHLAVRCRRAGREANVARPTATLGCLAGSAAMGTLNLSVQQLLEVCAGAPTEAVEVLKQVQTTGSPLKGVNATTLLDTGVRAAQLGMPAMRELADLHADHMRKFGFTL